MITKTALHALWLFPLVLFVALTINSITAQGASALVSNWAYPPPATSTSFVVYPPPLASPTPALPPEISEAAQKALEYITKRDGIPMDALMIDSDHPTEYPSLGRKFQVIAFIDTRPNGKIYKLLVDLADGRIEENISALLDAEAQAYQLKYGKLDPALYERLQGLNDDDTLTVAVWVAAQPQKTLADLQQAAFATLAAKYPQAQAAMQRSGKPMDVDDPELAKKIEADYKILISDEMKARTLPLITELEQRKFTVTTYDGMPSFTTVLSKKVILELSKRGDVSAIYLAEGQLIPLLDSAIPNTFAPMVWARGYQGGGVMIAIVEQDNVDPNSYINISPISTPGVLGIGDHATHVANAAASFHSTYKGMAPGATILSAGDNGSPQGVVTALQWAIDIQHAPIANLSEGSFENPANINWLDKAFDYWARYKFKTIVVGAGNNNAGNGYISSPGKAWNVLTVGAYDDHNNLNWSDDSMLTSQDLSYINPPSPHNDREKPEVVAVGANVTTAVSPEPRLGTSFAAPQVAGLAALLVSRNSSLAYWPEGLRAIIMASANHNIEGPSIIVRNQGDLKDGVGAINADLADQAAQVHATTSMTCNFSCWWGDSLTNSNFPVGTQITRKFNATINTPIRVAIAWWAHADTPANNYSFSRLDTDLDFYIKHPNGQTVTGSASFDNNYEIAEFVAPQSGQYQIVITKVRANEEYNYMGTAVVMIVPSYHKIYLPLIIK